MMQRVFPAAIPAFRHGHGSGPALAGCLLACLFLLLPALPFPGLSSPAFAAEAPAGRAAIGKVARIQGEAASFYNTLEHPLTEGDPVYRNDTLTTGAESRLQVVLDDGTDLILGEKAALLVSDLIAPPSGTLTGAAMASLRGAFMIAAPKTPGAEVRTPAATIGIRGTRFWGGPLDTPTEIMVVEGVVAVYNSHGEVLLSSGGEGTSLVDDQSAPTPTVRWSRDKADRAYDMVTFR